MSDATLFLGAIDADDPKAAEELLPLVYEELRRLAAHKMINEVPGQTLQPPALVHEAWLRLSHQSRSKWKNREQFFAVAAEVMRRILVDRARRRRAQKRGGDLERADMDGKCRHRYRPSNAVGPRQEASLNPTVLPGLTERRGPAAWTRNSRPGSSCL